MVPVVDLIGSHISFIHRQIRSLKVEKKKKDHPVSITGLQVVPTRTVIVNDPHGTTGVVCSTVKNEAPPVDRFPVEQSEGFSMVTY